MKFSKQIQYFWFSEQCSCSGMLPIADCEGPSFSGPSRYSKSLTVF